MVVCIRLDASLNYTIIKQNHGESLGLEHEQGCVDMGDLQYIQLQ